MVRSTIPPSPPSHRKGAKVIHVNLAQRRWVREYFSLGMSGEAGRVRDNDNSYRGIVCLHYPKLEKIRRMLGPRGLPSLRSAGIRADISDAMVVTDFYKTDRLAEELSQFSRRGLRLPTLWEAENLIMYETAWVTRACKNKRLDGFVVISGSGILGFNFTDREGTPCLGAVLIEKR
jgi:hypothetical protein